MQQAKTLIGWTGAALGVVLTLLLASQWAARPEPFDDAFIAFRFAENAVEGNGLVFNHGEKVEGFSSPLFMALLVLAGKCGIGFVSAAKGINGLAMAITLVLSACWVRALVPQPAGRISGLVAVGAAWTWLVLHPSSQLYLTSGMETWLFSSLLLGFAFVCRNNPVGETVSATGRRALGLGLLATLLALTRPEGLALVPLAAIVACMDAGKSSASRLRALALCLSVPAVVLGGLLLVRLAYYGLPLPNTYYAKIGSSDLGRWTRGIEYVLRESPWLVTPAVLFALVAKTATRHWIALFGLWAFGLAFSIYSGGDWMPGSRFLVPSLVALAPMVGVLGSWAWKLFTPLVWWQRAATLGLLTLLGGNAMLAQLETVRLQHREADWIHTFTGVAHQIAEEQPTALVATGGIGIVGYQGKLKVLDVFGLTEPAIAKAGKWASAGTAGHQSYDGEFVWSRQPNVLLPHSVVTDAPLAAERFLETVLAAPEPNRFWMAEFAAQPGFSERYRYRVFEPTPGRYVGAYQHTAEAKQPAAEFP